MISRGDLRDDDYVDLLHNVASVVWFMIEKLMSRERSSEAASWRAHT